METLLDFTKKAGMLNRKASLIAVGEVSKSPKNVWMRILRILVFATIYFLVHLIFLFSFIMRAYSGSGEFAWYLQHPLEAIRAIIGELSHSPILLIPFFTLILCCLGLGFITDLAISFIWKYIKHKGKSHRREHNAEVSKV